MDIYLFERPRETATHPVLLRKQRLIAQRPRVIVRDDCLARLVEQERCVAAVVPRCMYYESMKGGQVDTRKLTHRVPVRPSVRPVRVLLERAHREELVERNLLVEEAAEVTRRRLELLWLGLPSLMCAPQRVRFLLLMFSVLTFLDLWEWAGQATVWELQHLLLVRLGVEPGGWHGQSVERRLRALRDVPV